MPSLASPSAIKPDWDWIRDILDEHKWAAEADDALTPEMQEAYDQLRRFIAASEGDE